MFNPVFMFMHPREIRMVMDSVKSVVNIPRVWFKAYNERQVMIMMNKFVENTDYTHYIISSDDAVIYKKSFDTCLKYGAQTHDGVFTGYCNQHLKTPLVKYENGEERRVVTDITNVHGTPLRLKSPSEGPVSDDYPSWSTLDDVLNREGVFRQYLAGMALTCYPRKILLDFPLGVYPSGFSSDHEISYRLHKAGVKVWTHPDAFLLHLKQAWSGLAGGGYEESLSRWTVGQVRPSVILELDTNNHEVTSDEVNSRYHLEELGVETVSTKSDWTN